MISDIVQGTLCKEVKVIFEASERANADIQESFRDFDIFRGSKRVPLTRKRQVLPDFCAVFHSVELNLTTYTEVDEVITPQAGTND